MISGAVTMPPTSAIGCNQRCCSPAFATSAECISAFQCGRPSSLAKATSRSVRRPARAKLGNGRRHAVPSDARVRPQCRHLFPRGRACGDLLGS